MKESTKTPIIVAAVVALLVGGGAGFAIGASKMDDTANNNNGSNAMVAEPSAPAADLRVGLNNLLNEHVASSLDVTRAIVDGAPQAELDGALSAQTANAVAIAGAVGSIYGEEAQATITEQFVEHIEQSNAYASAVAAGDEAAKAEALAELREYLTDISGFFSGAIETLPQDAVYALLEEHENLLNSSIEAYNDGDFTRSYELEREALAQVSGIADALAGGIVATQPDQF